MAFGNWRVFEERVNFKVVQQQDNVSCGAACGEMLLKVQGITNITQVEIAKIGSVPISPAFLASVLNTLSPSELGEWRGGGLEIEGANFSDLLDCLVANGIWAAELREVGASLAHLVIVDGIDIINRVLIRDPWEGTSYKMEREEFLKYWTIRGVFWVGT